MDHVIPPGLVAGTVCWGHVVIVRPVEAGGMGEVFEARGGDAQPPARRQGSWKDTPTRPWCRWLGIYADHRSGVATQRRQTVHRSFTQMMAVGYASTSGFRASAPKALWKDVYSAGTGASCGMSGVSSSNYVAPVGGRFLRVKNPSKGEGTKVVVVLNWADQLKDGSRVRVSDGRALAR